MILIEKATYVNVMIKLMIMINTTGNAVKIEELTRTEALKYL